MATLFLGGVTCSGGAGSDSVEPLKEQWNALRPSSFFFLSLSNYDFSMSAFLLSKFSPSSTPLHSLSIFSSPQPSGFTPFLLFPITSVHFLPVTFYLTFFNFKAFPCLSTSPCLLFIILPFSLPKSLSKPLSYPSPPVLKSWIWIVGR